MRLRPIGPPADRPDDGAFPQSVTRGRRRWGRSTDSLATLHGPVAAMSHGGSEVSSASASVRARAPRTGPARALPRSVPAATAGEVAAAAPVLVGAEASLDLIRGNEVGAGRFVGAGATACWGVAL